MDDPDLDPLPPEHQNLASPIREIPRSATSSPKSPKPRSDLSSSEPDLPAGGSLAASSAAVVEIQHPAELCSDGRCSAAASTVVEATTCMVAEPVAALDAALPSPACMSDGCGGAGSDMTVSGEADHGAVMEPWGGASSPACSWRPPLAEPPSPGAGGAAAAEAAGGNAGTSAQSPGMVELGSRTGGPSDGGSAATTDAVFVPELASPARSKGRSNCQRRSMGRSTLSPDAASFFPGHLSASRSKHLR